MDEILELEKAIEHCKDVQLDNCVNGKCAMEHKQLEMWLTELLAIKKSLIYKHEILTNTTIDYLITLL